MSEKSEPKPCAHCGCAKVIIIDREVAPHIDHELFLLEIRCTDCTANIQCYGSKLGDSLAESIRRVREHLIAAWNRRAAPEPAPSDLPAVTGSEWTRFIPRAAAFFRDNGDVKLETEINDLACLLYQVARAGLPVPEPAQGDWERARLYLSGFHVELYDGINRADIEPQKVIDSLAAEFARVRAEATKAERERCEKVLSRQLEYIEAARALQRKLNGIFPNHRPLYHANGGLCREADYHKELKDLNHALDEVAAAIRKGEP